MKNQNRKHVRTSSEYSDRTRVAIYRRLMQGWNTKKVASRFHITQQSAAAFKFNLVKFCNSID